MGPHTLASAYDRVYPTGKDNLGGRKLTNEPKGRMGGRKCSKVAAFSLIWQVKGSLSSEMLSDSATDIAQLLSGRMNL